MQLRDDEELFTVTNETTHRSYPVAGWKGQPLESVWRSQMCWFSDGDAVTVRRENGEEKMFRREVMYEYDVYHRHLRDAQVYAGDPDNGSMMRDDRSWKDIGKEILLDTVYARDEKAAVKQVAEAMGFHKDNLYALQHIVSMEDGTGRMEAATISENGEIFVEIETPDHRIVRVDETGKIHGSYLLSWNDEYLDQCIIAGPVPEEEAPDEMRRYVVERLVQLNVAPTLETAVELYEKAANAACDDEMDELHVSDIGASIRYGGEYEERLQIVNR